MTVVSNDPSWWPVIGSNVFLSYWSVAAGVVVVYDWMLTLGQEIELIWMRYIVIPYSVISVLPYTTMVSLTDTGCSILDYTSNVTNVVIPAMLGVIMVARLHAMYQRSSIMLIFIVIIFLVVNIACGVIMVIVLEHSVGEELLLSGMYMCDFEYEGDVQLLISMIWTLNTVWEVLALCLSVWIAAKHFRDLRRFGPSTSTGSAIGDCFRVLIKSHVLYFASFLCVSCLQLVSLSPKLMNSNSIGAQIPDGASQILSGVQMFVLGPRLVLSVREYHAQLVAGSRTETSISSIVLQERVYVPTSSTV